MKIIFAFILAAVLGGICHARDLTLAWDPQPEVKFAVVVKQSDGSWLETGTSDAPEFSATFPDIAFEVAVVAYQELPDNGGRVSSPRSKSLIIPQAPAAPTGLRIRVMIDVQIDQP